MAYDEKTVLAMNPLDGGLSLPGWDESYTLDGLRDLLKQYESIDEEQLWKNLEAFLTKVIPVAHEVGIDTQKRNICHYLHY